MEISNFLDGRVRSHFTKGGLNHFKALEDATKIESEQFNKNREGTWWPMSSLHL